MALPDDIKQLQEQFKQLENKIENLERNKNNYQITQPLSSMPNYKELKDGEIRFVRLGDGSKLLVVRDNNSIITKSLL